MRCVLAVNLALDLLVDNQYTSKVMDEDAAFGKRIRDAMDLHGISNADLAKRMKSKEHTVHSWRYGRRRPHDLGKLRKLARVLKLSMGELLGEAS